MTPPLVYGTPVPFIRFLKIDENMRPDIKRRRECSDHRSEVFEIGSPPPLSGAGEDMSERPRRQPSASPLHSPSPSAFVAAVPSLRLGATRRHSGDPLPAVSLCFVAPASFGRRFRNVLFSPPHVGGSNSCKLACHGSAISPRHTPTSPNTKKGRRFRLPSGISNSYSSNPCTTVSSVDESNAFAASVTGK